MGNAIVDMVLGLVLLYLLLAILVSKLQEILDGQVRGGRAKVLHRMVLEAVGRDAGLKDRVMLNPAVFALHEGDDKPQESRRGWALGAASGPSSIPADVFARALLVELHADGRGSHPSARFATPGAFLAQRAPAAAPNTDAGRIWATLRSLLAGREADWTAFEAAIARYFSDIGDRADGWFRRRSAKWSWWLALTTAVVLNVDTVQVAERLSKDADLRGSLAGLARQVDALFPSGQEAPRDKAQAALSEIAPPEPALDRVDRLLGEALLRTGRVFWRDNQVAGTKLDKWMLVDKKGATAADMVHSCGNRLRLEQPKSSGTPQADRLAAPEFVSNPGTWLVLLPALQQAVQAAALRGNETLPAEAHSTTRRATLAEVHDCLVMLAGQVRTVAAARGDTSQEGADLLAAAAALDKARVAVREQVGGGQQRLPVARLFQRDPELFVECVQAGASSQQSLRRCIDTGAAAVLRLPVFFTADNRRQQFCRPQPWPGTSDGGGLFENWMCGDPAKRRVAAQPALGMTEGLQLGGPTLADVAFWFFGCALTAVFVALGAPFWFDALGKVSKLRAAGDVRRPEAAAADAVQPAAVVQPPMLPSGTEPFALARNLTETALTPADIVALQRALGVAATGTWDKPTRDAIGLRARQERFDTGEEMSLLLYERIVGRSMSAAIGPRSDGSLVLREPHPLAPTLAMQLCVLLGFNPAARLAGGTPPTTFDDDLRALAVLYRIKAQTGVHPRLTTAAGLASSNRAALDTLDLAMANEMIAACLAAAAAGSAPPQFGRSGARWLDWALGELGQIEKNAADVPGSNPRIVEYHRAGGAPGTADAVPWCAAFVTWVLDKARSEVPAIPAAPAAPRLADSWSAWGTAVTLAGAQAGDLVCLRMDGDPNQPADHIAIVLEADAGGVWAVGGNEGGQGQVRVSRYRIGQVLAVRRP